MRTLVIDNDYFQAQTLQETMLSFGACNIADNKIDALKLFQEAHNENNPFTLVILESNFPETTGIDTIHQIREFENSNTIDGLEQCKVFVTTANSNFEHIKLVFSAQIEGLLEKPIDKDKLINLLLEFEML